MAASYFTFVFFITITLFYHQTNSQTVQLVPGNIDQVLKGNEFVIVNFYADWCRFSQMLSPVYDNAASLISKEFPQEGKVAFAKVDCDKQTGIAAQYHVSKYPTLKMFRHGSLMKKEYRGQRSQDAISTFVRDQLKEPLNRVNELEDLDELDRKKRHIIGYFSDDQHDDYKGFVKVASTLRDECLFHAAIGPMSDPERIAGNKVVFRPNKEMASDMLYTGNLRDEKFFKDWTQDKCTPLVREITFENAEELTEEGLPFLILFHTKEDTETPEKFRMQVARELLSEKSSVNFLTADGAKFTHPLYHLGKTIKDLPILAIDSFRHMYIWKLNPKTDMDKPNLLKQFIADLHSGKLHREFHHGADPTETPKVETKEEEKGSDEKMLPKDEEGEETEKPKQPTSPPESMFKKLAPSKSRYTLLRDEL